ncbi:MAG: hypothetical protein HFK09_06230 [Clostridia bacterium]|nr:hypothetical protein [Clostridia bacterium]
MRLEVKRRYMLFTAQCLYKPHGRLIQLENRAAVNDLEFAVLTCDTPEDRFIQFVIRRLVLAFVEMIITESALAVRATTLFLVDF